MKYSLMSLMVDEELCHEKPTFFMKTLLAFVGVTECPEDVHEACRLLEQHGLPVPNGTATFEDLVRFTKENGFDGLDLMSFQMERPGNELRTILEKYGVVLSAVNIVTPFSEAGSEEVFQEMLRNTKKEIDRAAEAGAGQILLVPGGYGRGEGISREQAFRLMVRGLAECVKYAREKGMVISTEALESIRVPWSSLGEMQRVLNAVPGLMYTHDTGNPLVAHEDPLELCRTFWDRVISVHFKDLGRSDGVGNAYRTMDGDYLCPVPSGTGIVDFAGHLNLLAQQGYNGYITIEGGRPGGDKWQQALNALQYFRDLEQTL